MKGHVSADRNKKFGTPSGCSIRCVHERPDDTEAAGGEIEPEPEPEPEPEAELELELDGGNSSGVESVVPGAQTAGAKIARLMSASIVSSTFASIQHSTKVPSPTRPQLRFLSSTVQHVVSGCQRAQWGAEEDRKGCCIG